MLQQTYTALWSVPCRPSGYMSVFQEQSLRGTPEVASSTADITLLVDQTKKKNILNHCKAKMQHFQALSHTGHTSPHL